MFLLSHRVIVKPCQADDFLGDSSISLVHLHAVEPGTQGQRAGDAHCGVPAVGAQLQHRQRALLHQHPVQDLPYTPKHIMPNGADELHLAAPDIEGVQDAFGVSGGGVSENVLDCLSIALMNFFRSLSPLVHLTSRVSTTRARYHPLWTPFISFSPSFAFVLSICPSSNPPSSFVTAESKPGQVQVPPSCSHKALWAIAPPIPSALSAPPPAHLRMRLRAKFSWMSDSPSAARLQASQITLPIRPLTFKRLLVPDLLRRPPFLLSGCRYTQLGPARKPGAVKHLRPLESERAHNGHAAVPYGLAQAPARANRPAELRQAHRSEQRAQELLGVPVAQLGDEGQPGRRLLLGLSQGVMAEQPIPWHRDRVLGMGLHTERTEELNPSDGGPSWAGAAVSEAWVTPPNRIKQSTETNIVVFCSTGE
ncbi:hypothetical protein F7725_020886 [Dissostichus mawsoni]|uniref:Uncharacterized protein n=1 Tax=Dissostichus mawsoni TaxID=36200 RepID=A0A7J5YHV5_DISMA|nr:hypothetical protein F7725_020886 [Dissostichus mawsoni]